MAASGSDLHDLMLRLDAAFVALTVQLKAENAALTDKSFEELGSVCRAKLDCCHTIRDLESALGEVPLAQQVSESGDPKLEQAHSLLLAHAREAQDYNAVNGKIIQRAQQSTLELLQLIGGRDMAPLYGESGHTTATTDGAPIAQV